MVLDGLKRGAWLLRAAEYLNLLPFILALIVLTVFADRGFDVTDDGFYLLTARHPSDVVACPSLAYSSLAIIFRALGYDVVSFRVAAILLAVMSGAVLSCGLLRIASSTFKLDEMLPRASGVFFTCLGALLYYAWGVSTPSYNSVNAFGLTVSAGLILLALSNTPSAQLQPWVVTVFLFGAGWCAGLSLLAKFTAGISLVGLYTLLLLLWPSDPGNKFLKNVRSAGVLWVGLATFFLCQSVFIQSLADSKDLFLNGIKASVTLQAGHGFTSLARYGHELTALLQNSLHGFWLAFLVMLSGYALAEVARRKGRGAYLLPSAVILAVFLVVATLAWLKGLHRGGIPFVYGVMTFYFIWLAVLLCCLGLSALFRWHEVGRSDDRPWRKMFLVAGLLVILPFAGAVGSGNAITSGTIFCMAPWFGALFLLLVIISSLCHTRWIAVAGTAVVGLFACLQISSASLAYPYRLNGGVLSQVVPTKIGSPSTTLKLDSATSEFFTALRSAATANGFKAGDDVLAFYYMPGVVFAMGGRSPGLQWYWRGYSGSRSANELGLSLAAQERLRKAFILHDPGFTNAMPDLRKAGLSFPEDYLLCGRFVWPLTKATVDLWKPRDEKVQNTTPEPGQKPSSQMYMGKEG